MAKLKKNCVLPFIFSSLAVILIIAASVHILYEEKNELFIHDIKEYAGNPYIEVNDNIPFFTEEDYTTESYETYWKLDALGRCTGAIACVSIDLMPAEGRQSISDVYPSGWQTVEYEFVEQKYLYNRCHLIAFQLTGENANECNIITGTRYLNIEGMLPFENMISDYVKRTGNHVLYRVRPFYEGNDLVAQGVLMEAYSVEDNGLGICFNVFCYNVQPGVIIDYSDGSSIADGTVRAETYSDKSWYDEDTAKENASALYDESGTEYVLNTRRMKIHRPDCKSVQDMSPQNTYEIKAVMQELIDAGYSPCQNCKPE